MSRQEKKEEATDKLLKACEDDQHDLVKKLIDEKANVNDEKYRAEPLLNVAVKNFALKTVMILLHKKANIDAMDSASVTAISRAAGHFCIDEDNDKARLADIRSKMVKLLVNSRASLNIGPLPPLFGAILNKDFNLFKLLVDAKANVDVQSGDGMSLLEYAEEYEQKEMFEFIYNMDPTVPDSDFLHYAVRKKDQERVKYLLDFKVHPNAFDSNKMTPLDYAMQRGDLAIIRLILNAVSPSIVNIHKETPLHLALNQGFTDIMKELIEKKANLEARGRFGFTPLCAASFLSQRHRGFKNMNSILKILLDANANINAVNLSGITALRVLMDNEDYHDIQNVQLLLDAKASVNIADGEGFTALHLACVRIKLPAIKLLIKNKADINAIDNLKNTPGDLLREYSNKAKLTNQKELSDVLQMLVKAPVSSALTLQEADQKDVDINTGKKKKKKKLKPKITQNLGSNNPKIKKEKKSKIQVVNQSFLFEDNEDLKKFLQKKPMAQEAGADLADTKPVKKKNKNPVKRNKDQKEEVQELNLHSIPPILVKEQKVEAANLNPLNEIFKAMSGKNVKAKKQKSSNEGSNSAISSINSPSVDRKEEKRETHEMFPLASFGVDFSASVKKSSNEGILTVISGKEGLVNQVNEGIADEDQPGFQPDLVNVLAATAQNKNDEGELLQESEPGLIISQSIANNPFATFSLNPSPSENQSLGLESLEGTIKMCRR